MGHLKAKDLVAKSRGDLLEDLAALEKKLFELRNQKATSSSGQKLTEIRIARRDVARIKTVLMKQQRDALKKKYEGKKLIPKDLRGKQVKAVRGRLEPKYANKITKRAARRAKFLKPIKFALKA